MSLPFYSLAKVALSPLGIRVGNMPRDIPIVHPQKCSVKSGKGTRSENSDERKAHCHLSMRLFYGEIVNTWQCTMHGISPKLDRYRNVLTIQEFMGRNENGHKWGIDSISFRLSYYQFCPLSAIFCSRQVFLPVHPDFILIVFLEAPSRRCYISRG